MASPVPSENVKTPSRPMWPRRRTPWFIDAYFAPRKHYVPPDRLTLVMATYDDMLTVAANEDQCGRFFVKWDIPPTAEFLAGYVIDQSEFCKQFYIYGTQDHPNLADQPFVPFSNGMCWDTRRFQWQDVPFAWYDVLYVFNDTLVVFEHDIDLEPM